MAHLRDVEMSNVEAMVNDSNFENMMKTMDDYVRNIGKNCCLKWRRCA